MDAFDKLKKLDIFSFISKNINLISELLYYLIFILVFMDSFSNTSLFKCSIIRNDYILISLSIGYVAFKLSITKCDSKENIFFIMFSIIVLMAFGYEYMKSEFKYFDMLIYGLLILGAKDIPFKRIIKLSFLLAVILTSITIILSLLGYIENIIFVYLDGRVRRTFGFIYAAEFTSHIFFISCLWVYIRKNKLHIIEIIVLLSINVIAYLLSKTRVSILTTFVLISLLFFIKLMNYLNNKKNGKNWCINKKIVNRIAFLPLILAFLMFYLGVLYEGQSSFIITINKIFNSRVYLTNKCLSEYGLSLWSKFVPMTVKDDVYNFLDCCYMHILIRFGIVVFALFMIVMVKSIMKSGKNNDIFFIVIMIAVSLHAFIEYRLLDVSFNPFLLYLFADSNTTNSLTNKLIIKLKSKCKNSKKYMFRQGGRKV